jgi:holo-[acyl-carrier protein] synthase
MIVGIGIDAVEVARIRRALERHPRFRQRVFTKAELEAAARRGVGEVAYLAKRWAAKEATSKALGVGFSGFAYTEIEVTNLPSGAPTIKLSGELADWAHLLGALRWHLTLSDTKDTAFASVLVEGPDDYPRRPSGPPPWVRRRLDRQRGPEGSGGLKPSPPVGGGSGGLKPSPPVGGGSGGRNPGPPVDQGS